MSNKPDEPEWPVILRADELAQRLKMPIAGVYDLIKKLPPHMVIRLGRRVRVREREFLEWLNAGGNFRL